MKGGREVNRTLKKPKINPIYLLKVKQGYQYR